MKFIVAPAKKMNVADDVFAWKDLPRFVSRAEELMHVIRELSYDEAQKLWKTSDALTSLNYDRFRTMDVRGKACALSPAVFSYEGIQYQHLAPCVMEESQLAYVQEHLRILSGFYGILRPFDGVVPYRLEMQAKLSVGDSSDVYGFWGDELARALAEETDSLVNLASVEYAKAVLPYAGSLGVKAVTCLFGRVREDGSLLQRATAAKAARGSMVRWCAENEIATLGDLRAFDVAGYRYRSDLSDENTFIFEESGR